MQSYPLNLTAAVFATSFANDADLFVYESSASPAEARIIVKPENGSEIILKPGQSFRIKGNCSRWFVRSFDGVSTILGNVIIGSGYFLDNGVVGTVSILDGGKSRTLAGMAFAVATAAPSVAAQFATVQIWNPVGNAKRVVVEKIYISSANSGLVKMGWNTAANAALNSINSKLAGGAVASSSFSATTLAGNPTGFQFSGQLNVVANQTLVIELREPIILPPGFGFSVQQIAAAYDLNVTFEMIEEPI